METDGSSGSLSFMGDVLGAEEEAEKLAAYAEETFEDIAEMNVPEEERYGFIMEMVKILWKPRLPEVSMHRLSI